MPSVVLPSPWRTPEQRHDKGPVWRDGDRRTRRLRGERDAHTLPGAGGGVAGPVHDLAVGLPRANPTAPRELHPEHVLPPAKPA